MSPSQRADNYLFTIVRNVISNDIGVYPNQVESSEVKRRIKNKEVNGYTIYKNKIKSIVNGIDVVSYNCGLIDKQTGLHYMTSNIS